MNEGRFGRSEQSDREWEWRYWEWLIPVLAALMVTLCFFIAWGLAASSRITTTAGGVVTAVAVVPTVVATVAPAVLPTAPAVATPLPAVVIQAPEIQGTNGTVFAGAYTFAGTGTPASTVEVLVNDTSAGNTQVGADGLWSIDTTLEAGTASIVAQALDEAGAVAAEASAISIDVQSLEAPTFNVPTGALVGGPIALSGTGTPGSQVRVTIDDTDVGTALVGADGTWELDTIISNGERTVVVGALDNIGEVVTAADPITFTVAGGLGVTLDMPKEGTVLQPGTNTISGTGKTGTALEVLDGDLVLGTATVGTTGTWTVEVDLPEGSASISVREEGSDNILARPVRVQVGTSSAVLTGCGAEIKTSCPAWVTRSGGLTLRMRSEPAIAADNVVARLPIGTGLEVTEGPETANGFTWWRVITRGSNEGWVAGENLVTQPD